jgi:hypothetical protein
MPVPLERRRWFQNGPEVPHESSQIAPQLETVKLEQSPVVPREELKNLLASLALASRWTTAAV